MKFYKKFYLINFFIFFFSSLAAGDTKIAYVNLDLILSESKPGKLLFSQLNEIEENKIKKFKNDELNLKEEEKKLISTKNIISSEEYNKNVINFKKKIDNYRKIKNSEIENLKKKRNKEILRFLTLINPIIEKIMDENSLEILFEKKNIFIAKSNCDITKIIIDNINKNITEFKIQE
jgi:Skp family chaperone for outer membrane proteins